MGLADLFGKKKLNDNQAVGVAPGPEEVSTGGEAVEDVVTSSEEARVDELAIIEKVKQVKSEKKVSVRGPGGRFVSKKSSHAGGEKPYGGVVKQSLGGVWEPKVLNFYGKEMRLWWDGEKWWMAVADMLGVAKMANPPEVRKKEGWQKVSQAEIKMKGGEECADLEGILKLVKEVEDPFPGAFGRWVTDLQAMR